MTKARQDRERAGGTPAGVVVRMGNAQNTSLGACSPGDEVALPWDEAQALVQAGYATRIGTVADERVTRP